MPRKKSDLQEDSSPPAEESQELQGTVPHSRKNLNTPRGRAGEDDGCSIRWTGQLSKLLAYKMQDEYKSKWLSGTKIAAAKQWAIDLGLEKSDPKGLKTKATVLILIKKYKEALDLSNRTGFGDTTHVVEGVEVPLTALAQLKAICPHWEILDSFMRSEFECNTQTTDLTESGLPGDLKLQAGDVEQGRDEDTTGTTTNKDNSATPEVFLRTSQASQGVQSTGVAIDARNRSNATVVSLEDIHSELHRNINLALRESIIDHRTPKAKKARAAQLLKPSPTFELDNASQLSGSDGEQEKPSLEATKQQKRNLFAAQDPREITVKKKKLTGSKLEHETDIYNRALETWNRRLTVDEMKYRARAGEKSKEQRQHELAMLELEVKREQFKKEIEELRLKQLQYQREIYALENHGSGGSPPRSRSVVNQQCDNNPGDDDDFNF